MKDGLESFFRVKNENEYTELFKSGFSIHSENSTEKPLVFVLWETVWRLYNNLYSSNPENSSNTLGILVSSSKDLANLLIVNFIRMLKNNFLFAMQRNPQNQDFKEKEGIMSQFAEKLFNIFDEFSLESDRVSIILAQVILEFSQDFLENRIMTGVQFPLKVFQKLESFIRMSFENEEFPQKIKNDSEAKFIYNRIVHFTLILHEYVENLDEQTLGPQIKHLQDYLSKFEVIDFISNLPTPQEKGEDSNAYLRKIQERLIRSYVSFHIKIDTKTLDDTDKNNYYYTRERLHQIWITISKYCKYENYFSEELQNCWDIIRAKREQDPTFEERLDEIFTREILVYLFKNCLFAQDFLHLDEIKEQGDILERHLLESLFKNQEDEVKIFWEELGNCIHELFKKIIQEGEVLEKLYNEKNPLFYKQYLIIENKMNRFSWVINFLAKITSRTLFCSHFKKFLKAFEEGLWDLMVSPIFFFIEYNSNSRFRNLFSKCNIGDSDKNSLDKISRAFIKLGEKSIDLIQMIEHNLMENQNVAYLHEKLIAGFGGSRYDSPFREKEPYFNDLRISFQIKSKLVPVAFLRCLERSRVHKNMILDLVKFYKKDLKTSMKSLVNITFCFMKHKITEDNKIDIMSFDLFNDRALYFDIKNEELKEYFKEKFLIFVDMISNPDPTKTFEEDFLWRLAALKNFFQLYDLLHVNFEDLWIKDEIMAKVSPFMIYILEGFNKLILEYSPNINSISFLSELSIQPKANSMFSKEDNLKEFTRIALDIIVKQLSCINFGLCYLANDGLVHKEKSFQSLWNVFTKLIDTFDERMILMSSLGDDHKLLNNFIWELWSCYLGFLEQMITLKSNKEGEDSILICWKKNVDKGKGKKKGLFDLEDFMDNLQENSNKPENEQKNEKMEEENLKEILNAEFFKKWFLKLMIFSAPAPRRNLTLHDEIFSMQEKALLEILNEVKPFILIQGEIMPSIKQVKGLDVEIYSNKIANRIRILSSILSNLRLQFEINFSTKMESTLEVEFEIFQDTLNLLIKEISYLITELHVEDILEMNQFIRVDFLGVFWECIFSLIDFTFQKLEYYLIKGEILEDIYQNFNLISLAIKKFRKIVVGHNEAKEYLESFFNQKTCYKLILLMFFILHDPTQLKKFIEDKEFLNIVFNFSGFQIYNIAEVFALQAYDPEIILSIKLKSLAYLDKTGKRIYQNSSIKFLEQYWSREMQKAWKENFSIQRESSTGANIIKIKENKGFFPP